MSALVQASIWRAEAVGGIWANEDENLPGTTVLGWVLAAATGPTEVGLDIQGLGVQTVVADREPPAGLDVPPDARMFSWRPPPEASLPTEYALRAFDLDSGRELDGSPVLCRAVRGPVITAPPLGRWPHGLAGVIGSADRELTPDLWVGTASSARALRFEALAPVGGQRRGVRLLALAPPVPRVVAYLAPTFTAPAAGERVTFFLDVWLPQATGPNQQAQCEIWLARRDGGSFVLLRRLRRARIFRRPSTLQVEWATPEPEPGQETAGEADADKDSHWLAVVVRDGPGLCVMAPTLDGPPEQPARMEDSRLEASFAALAELVRLHGTATEQHPLLPPLPAPARPWAQVQADYTHPFTEIILPVYNGNTSVRDCLRSLRAAATDHVRVLVIDDGSRSLTAEMLRAETDGDPFFRLHHRVTNRGYTKSINEGLALTTADWVVVLNSDTIVPPGWLERLHTAVRARPGTGMAGPLSNAATWQSIPAAKRPDGTWSTNDMIEPRHATSVQALLTEASERAYPEFPALNGFCTLIARAVFDEVGPYDEDAFPMGYGEETDLCLRARRAGFRLTVADDAFVFHEKSVSFGSANRRRLTRAGNLELSNKHLGANIGALEAAMAACEPMQRLRLRMAERLRELD